MEVGLGPGHIVLDGDPDPSPERGQSPRIFGPCLLWPTAGWIKMPLGTEVGFGPGDFVFDGDPSPPEKRHCPTQKGGRAPQFSAHVYCGETAGWMKMRVGTEVEATLC